MSKSSILDADMQTLAGWIGQGWRWWLGEMAQMVPAALRHRARGQIAHYRPQTGEILLSYDPQGGYPDTRGAISLILPPELCLTRSLQRPLMSQRDLEGMVALEAGQILPMAAGDAVLAARIAQRDEAHRRMQCGVVALPLSAARDLGAALQRLERPCLAVYAGHDSGVDLLPALRRAGLVGGGSDHAAQIWLIVGFLFALNIGLLVWRDHAATQKLADIVAQQQPAVNAARRIEARISQIDALAASAQAQRQNAEPLAALSHISAALPAGVWLQRYGWQGDGLRISGFRPAQADITAALRRAGFSVTRYSESAATGPSTLGQAFEVTLRARKQP
jgi:hypothetical protein